MENNMKKLWVEKYRPQTVDEMVLADDVKTFLSDPENISQNIMLIGHSGIGKSTLAKIIAKDILKCQYLYINASDENGIDTIRSKVTNFVSTKSFDGKQKLVILDESDGLSKNAQQALRFITEEYTSTSIFILTANYGYKIIEALRSRCAVFNLKYDHKDYIKYILGILKKEGVTNLKEVVPYIKSFYPDFRKCLNDLQKRYKDGEIILDSELEYTDFLNELWEILTEKDIDTTRKFVIENENKFEGDYSHLGHNLFHFVCSLDIPEAIKLQSVIYIGECVKNSPEKVDLEINIFTALAQIKQLWMNNKKQN
jgi:DNA polymerase III delta prime subunit